MAFAVSITLYVLALDLAPFTLLAKSQFFLPVVNGRIVRSSSELVIGT